MKLYIFKRQKCVFGWLLGVDFQLGILGTVASSRLRVTFMLLRCGQIQ